MTQNININVGRESWIGGTQALTVAPSAGIEIGLQPTHMPSLYERAVKPVIDRVLGAVLLMALLPVLALTAMLLAFRLGSPVLLRQQRIGLHGRPFPMYKFRTMLPDQRVAERRNAWRPDSRDRRTSHKTAADPRHTRIGRFLRKWSLDELPQLWNVIRGDMSLVGPRPELAAIVAGYEPWQHSRHVVRPGLTGLWQVTERGSGELMHEHVDIDLRYVEKLSLREDLRIMLLTVPAALGMRKGS